MSALFFVMREIKVTSMSKFYALCLLYEKPCHGYELIKTINKKTGKKIGPGQIYPFLAELEKKGFIVSGKRQERDKLKYSMTKKGKLFFRQMLNRFEELIEIAIQPSLKKCSHCGCKLFKGSHKEKIGKTKLVFCCEYCAKSFKRIKKIKS